MKSNNTSLWLDGTTALCVCASTHVVCALTQEDARRIRGGWWWHGRHIVCNTSGLVINVHACLMRCISQHFFVCVCVSSSSRTIFSRRVEMSNRDMGLQLIYHARSSKQRALKEEDVFRVVLQLKTLHVIRITISKWCAHCTERSSVVTIWPN